MNIPGSNNGTWGLNMSRGAVFPPVLNGPFGYQGYPLPNMIQHPTGVMGRGFGTIYQLTPGGITTEEGWGFKNKIKSFGKSRKSRKSRKFRKNK